jgi:hypothetical protein
MIFFIVCKEHAIKASQQVKYLVCTSILNYLVKALYLFLFNDRLIIYGFTSRSRIFHLYGDVTITGEGLQNLGLCSALRAFEQRGIYIVPHLL